MRRESVRQVIQSPNSLSCGLLHPHEASPWVCYEKFLLDLRSLYPRVLSRCVPRDCNEDEGGDRGTRKALLVCCVRERVPASTEV